MKICQFLNSNEEFLSKQMKSLSFIQDTNNYIQQENQKNYNCQIKFEKPKFKLNVCEKFEKIPLLPSDNLKPPKTAPPRKTTSLHVKLSKMRSAASNPNTETSTPAPTISVADQIMPDKSIFIAFSNKEKDIKEWAFKKNRIATKKREPSQQDDLNIAKLRYGHHFWFDEVDELNQNIEDVDLAQLENEDEDAEFYRNHRSANVNKALNQKNFTSKILDTKLIDLSKQRFKDIRQLEFQKKIFARKQLKKAKGLPGLK